MKELALLLDIGTTIIKGLLIEKASGKEICGDFVLNKQIKFGEDVITRIDFSLKGSDNARILKTAVAASINELIKRLLKKPGYKSSQIKEMVVVCNTAMHHLFLGLSAQSLIEPPYKPLEKSELSLKAKELEINIYEDAPVIILPNIGGFVGSDAIGLILACDMYKSNSIKLAIDIGTNGEIMLGSSSEILVTSTAAGPAFEARYVSCGMPAVKGAIRKVNITKSGSLKLSVIGNVSPKGVCGSGLIDLVAEMLRQGILDKTGRMKEENFLLYRKAKSKIYITQADIRKIQLAKAAIYAAAKILMRQLNIDISKVSKIYITGSFGSSIDVKNAILLGLIPKVLPSKVRFIKDGALAGAKKYLLSKNIQSQLTSILSRIKRIQLVRKDFQNIYADSMGFYS